MHCLTSKLTCIFFLYFCVRELHLAFVTKLSLCSPLVLALKNTNLSRNCPSASCSWCDMVSLSRLLQCKVKVCPLAHEQWAVVQGSQEKSYQADGMQSPKGVQGCLMFMMSVIHHLSTTIRSHLRHWSYNLPDGHEASYS